MYVSLSLCLYLSLVTLVTAYLLFTNMHISYYLAVFVIALHIEMESTCVELPTMPDVNPSNIKTLPICDELKEQSFVNAPKSLNHLVLDFLLENWCGMWYDQIFTIRQMSAIIYFFSNIQYFIIFLLPFHFLCPADNPVYEEIPQHKDRLYILQNLNVNLPLKILISHIQDDFFWRRSFQERWRTLYYEIYTYQPFPPHRPAPATLTNPAPRKKREQPKPWINIYMERHLQEMIENLVTTDYEQETIQATLDICAGYINQLEINHLQPSGDGLSGK